MKSCPKCGERYEKVSECPHIVIIDDNPLSIAAYLEEYPENARLLE